MIEDFYCDGLSPNLANYVPLTPAAFLERSAAAFPDKTAVIDGERRFSYRDFRERSRRLASALSRKGIGPGETVAVLAPNVPAMLEAHYGVPMSGAVLNALNTRLDADAIGFCLGHGEAKLAIVDAEYLPLIKRAIQSTDLRLALVVVPAGELPTEGEEDYESFLRTGDPHEPLPELAHEWSAISLGYTSGTTGNPKGVVCHHRGAYLNALGNVLAARLDPESVYLWTLPMFHCNGWSHTWAVTAAGGTHVCLRKIDTEEIFRLIDHEQVTHMSAAPVVLAMLADTAARSNRRRLERHVRVLTGGSVPPSAVLRTMEDLGFVVVNIYGQTETTGPSLICEWRKEWNSLPREERIMKNTRQGVRLVTTADAIVADPKTRREVASDGVELGEIMLRGNTVMMGYLKNTEATEAAMAGGWLRSGDIAVRHPDGQIEIKDRAKDIIISGGENISSVEIEEVLHSHPAVRGAAVVARPDKKWGEHPCAFLELNFPVQLEEIKDFCRQRLAGFKMPKTFVCRYLPRTPTGKIQKYVLREEARVMSKASDLPCPGHGRNLLVMPAAPRDQQ